MSLNQRRNIAMWFLLLAGISLIVMQCIKYANGTLDLKIEEAIVTVFAVTLVTMPKIIAEGVEKFINSKYGNKNES